MTLSEDLARLQDLHERGALTDDEFSRAKARLLDHGDAPASGPAVWPALAAINSLRRNRSDRWIAGVCSGIARATGVDSWVWRLFFALLMLFGGVGVVVYIVLWIFVPSE